MFYSEYNKGMMSFLRCTMLYADSPVSFDRRIHNFVSKIIESV